MLNDEWARFFAEHRFLIGISIDGPQALHDRYRTSRSGKGTHAQVLAALTLLQDT
ncbi:hypothetical protein HMPREF0774_2045, partial [Staphylococcus aureus subsp. aureus TCH130]